MRDANGRPLKLTKAKGAELLRLRDRRRKTPEHETARIAKLNNKIARIEAEGREQAETEAQIEAAVAAEIAEKRRESMFLFVAPPDLEEAQRRRLEEMNRLNGLRDRQLLLQGWANACKFSKKYVALPPWPGADIDALELTAKHERPKTKTACKPDKKALVLVGRQRVRLNKRVKRITRTRQPGRRRVWVFKKSPRPRRLWLRLGLVCTLRKQAPQTSRAWWPRTWSERKPEAKVTAIASYDNPFGPIEVRFRKLDLSPAFDKLVSLGAFGSINYVNDTQLRPVGIGRGNPMPRPQASRQVQALLETIRREIALEKLNYAPGKWQPDWLKADPIRVTIREPREPQTPDDPRFVPAKAISFRLAEEITRAGVKRLGERLQGALLARLKEAGAAMREMDDRIRAKTDNLADATQNRFVVEFLMRLAG
jgi:hypothetical protein